MYRNNPRLLVKQLGVSIIELMVALVIGLFISGGILYTYVASRSTYVSNDAISRVQEEGRIVMETLTRAVRQAGFMGCANALDLTARVIANPPTPQFTLGSGVQVFDNGSGWTNPTTITRVAGTDVISMRGMGNCAAKLTGNMTADNANIQVVSNPCGWQANDVLVISDCTSMDVFRATSVSNASGKITIAHANSTNSDNRLSKAYGSDALIYGYSENTFFIGKHPTLTDSSGIALPTLYQVQNTTDLASSNAKEIATNVYDLQILTVAIDTNSDSAPDSTVTSTGSPPALGAVTWSQALNVGLQFAMRSEANNVGPTAVSYTYDGNSVSDKRIKRTFSSVIGIRNRLP